MAIFRRRITQKINNAIQNKEPQVRRNANTRLNFAKNALMEIIDRDPISNRVLTSEFTRGYLGVTQGSNQVEPLKKVILNNTSISSRGTRRFADERRNSFIYNIKYPNKNQIYSDSSLFLPWGNKTWVEAMEIGIGNIENFLFIRGKGTSRLGIQAKNKVRGGGEIVDSEYLNRIRMGFSNSLSSAGLGRKNR